MANFCGSLVLLSFLFSFGLCIDSQNFIQQDLDKSARVENGRGFSRMFTSIRSNGRACTSNGQEGTCVASQSKCRSKGGTTSGDNCSNNGGVCCVIRAQCSSNTTSGTVTVTRNLTHLIEPSNYNAPSQCRFAIPRENNVCQLRLDFKRFALQCADFEGNCQADTLIITGADNLGAFTLCGEAEGQHLYLHYGASDTITLNFNLLNGQTGGRGLATHDVLVTKIPCTSNLRAPTGCTQYFRQTSDTVQSFNYPIQQLNDQRYSVCVQTFDGSSRIRWEKCPNSTFIVSGLNTDSKALSGTACIADYLEIFGAGRYCGSDFAEFVTSAAKPYAMFVNFNEEEFPSPGEQVNPMTLCPVGWECQDLGTLQPVFVPCNTNPNFACVPPAYFFQYVDTANVGFCLRYTVS